MIVTPSIRRVTRHADHAAIDMVVPAQLYYLEGHFPDHPLLPGVVQLNWAIDYAREHLSIAGEFRGVNALKFMRVIQPDKPVALTLNFNRASGELLFEYRNDAGICASGAVRFAP